MEKKNMEDIYQSATSTRANFSSVMDQAVYDRPQFIKRTRNQAILIGTECMNDLLANTKLHCEIETETDGSFILVCQEIEHLLATGKTLAEAKRDMATQMLDYAQEYYNEFGLYSRAANTKLHLEFVMKALSLGTLDAVEEMIECQTGKN